MGAGSCRYAAGSMAAPGPFPRRSGCRSRARRAPDPPPPPAAAPGAAGRRIESRTDRCQSDGRRTFAFADIGRPRSTAAYLGTTRPKGCFRKTQARPQDRLASAGRTRPALLLIFEPEVDLDPVLHDLAALDAGGGLDHFHRRDLAVGLAG